MRVADVVARTLANFGASRSFGMPGGEVLTVIDALNAAGIRFILARQETSAAIMAAGAATVTGAPGVLVTTVGPGLANAVNGIADASQEHAPLIVLSGVVDHAVRGRYTHQVIDQKQLLRAVVKGCFEIEAEGAGAVVARAIELAMSEPMGPVLIEIAPGTAQLPVADGDRARAPPRTLKPLYAHTGEAMDTVRQLLAAAQRPLIIAGFDAARFDASEQIGKLSEHYACPVLTTYKGKGVLPESHPLSLGAAGLSPLADRHLLPLVKQADVVVLVGYDPIEMRQGWLNPFDDAAEIIEISARAPDHGMHRVSLRIEGGIADILEGVLASGGGRFEKWVDQAPQKTKAALQQAFAPPAGWSAHSAIATLQRRLPPHATVTVDSGAHRILLSQMIKIERPLGLLQSAGFCTMGAALPLAIGVKSMHPSQPVFAVLGDGGLEMGLGELATLRDERLAVTVIVFQDESLALIELKQRQLKLADAGVRLGRTAYEDIARAFGGNGVRVASAEQFDAALQGAADAETFSLIVCDIKATDYADRI